MRKIGDMLASAVGRPEVLRTARANITLENWSTHVGPALASHCKPIRFDKGVVWVQTDGSAWAQDIRILQDSILAKLNDAAGEPLFTGLRVTMSTSRKTLGE